MRLALLQWPWHELAGLRMVKRIHYKIDKDDKNITLKDVLERINIIQLKNPEIEVFFDGDEFAICSRPRKEKEDKKNSHQTQLKS